MKLRSLTEVLGWIWREPSNRGQRWRRIFLFFGWQFWKRVVRTPVTATLCNRFRLRIRPDCDISPAALYYRIPNGEAISFLRSHLQGGTFLDIGANVGMASLLVADKVEHAILFEPSPTAAARAKENLALNHLSYEVVSVALSDQVGFVEFENAAGASAVNRVVDGFNSAVPTIKVPRTTLDQFLRDHGPTMPPIRAVKIDVEGHENSVIRGMKDFLKSHGASLIMFEYLERTDIRETIQLFAEAGYAVFELTPDGPRVATHPVESPQDLFACPTELLERFAPSVPM